MTALLHAGATAAFLSAGWIAVRSIVQTLKESNR